MNKYLKYLLRVIFLIIVIFLIKKMVFNHENFNKLSEFKDQINIKTFIILFLVFILQFINWILESIKFKYILSKKKQISFKDSVFSVYSGNATALFTPDRLGNFIGRFIYLNKINKKTITAATMLGNLAQLISTLIVALLALLLYLSIESKLTIPYISPFIIISFTTFTLSILVFAFYNPSLIINRIQNIRWFNKHLQTFEFLKKYTKKETTVILIYALLRYLIFIIQFNLVLNILGLSINSIETLMFSGLLYLFTTVIPSPIMGNLGTRELIALLLLSNYEQPEIVLIASLLIWIVNVIIPSLIGSFLIFKMNLFNKEV